MRKNIVAGNWKMNTTLPEGLALAKGLNAALKGKAVHCDVIVGVPFTHLASIVSAVDTMKIGVAAENCADKEKGAFTGEVSAAMVASTGAKYVILGHSERRAYYHETPGILKEKVKLALAHNLIPIFCIGEVLEEREAGKHFEVVDAQVRESLFELSAEEFGKLVLAYEPVWAIGTGTGDSCTHSPYHCAAIWSGGRRQHIHSVWRKLQCGQCERIVCQPRCRWRADWRSIARGREIYARH